jgi:hypothetical protein
VDSLKIKKDSMSLRGGDILKISWSKLRQFSECPMSWFCINYASMVDIEVTQINQTKAIPGTIIQKLFEAFINERIYSSREMISYEDILNWFNVNTKALYKLISIPIEDQFLLKYEDARKYFKSEEGKEDILRIQREYSLDTKISVPQIAFVDFQQLAGEYGNEEGLLQYLNSLYKPILDLFLEKNWDLDSVLSEVYIEVNIDGVILNGYIDFVYNKDTSPFSNIEQLKDNFIVYDGKYKVNRYTHREQLWYYATLLSLEYGKIPEHVGFIDWTKARVIDHKFNSEYIIDLRYKVLNLKKEYYRVKGYLKKCRMKRINIGDLNLDCNPTNNCIFCPMILNCNSALERKKDLISYMEGMENRRKVKEYMKDIEIDETKITQDITL